MNFGKYPLLYLNPILTRNKREHLGHFKITSLQLYAILPLLSNSMTPIEAWFVRFNTWEKKKSKKRLKTYRLCQNLSLPSPLMTTLSQPTPLPHDTESFSSLSDLQYPIGIHTISFLSKATSVLLWINPESSPLFSPNAFYSPLGLSWDIIPEPLG